MSISAKVTSSQKYIWTYGSEKKMSECTVVDGKQNTATLSVQNKHTVDGPYGRRFFFFTALTVDQ